MSDQRPQLSAEHKLINYLNEHGPQCPACRYSLKGLADIETCPECGSEIDHNRLAIAHVQGVISATTTWCGLGSIGWIISAYMWWLMHTIRIPAPMFEEPLDLSEHLDDLATTCIIFAFALCLIVWRFRSIKIIHAHAIKSDTPQLRVPRRIIIVAMPGIILGSFSVLLLLLFAIAS